MFNRLYGEISAKRDDRVYLRTPVVEWEIFTTGQSLEGLPEPGETAEIYTYLHHRDDQLNLFGFATADERSLFLDLLRVQSIGPKLAMKILSGISVARLLGAIDQEDVGTLVSVPGLGRTTAQKILIQLKDKLSVPIPAETANPADTGIEDIVAALIGMGFDKRLAVRVAAEAFDEFKDSSEVDQTREREVLRRAIQKASRGMP